MAFVCDRLYGVKETVAKANIVANVVKSEEVSKTRDFFASIP